MSENWAGIVFLLGVLCIVAGLILCGSMANLCLWALGLEGFGFLSFLVLLLIFILVPGSGGDWSNAALVFYSLLLALIKGIELVWLGISLSLLNLWIIGIFLIIASIIIYLLLFN